MADDDLPTRVTLVERTMVTRDMLGDREDKLLTRMEDMLKRYIKQASDDQAHALRVFGHEIAEQTRISEAKTKAKIHAERDEMDERREAEARAKQAIEEARRRPEGSPIRGWIAANWMWVGGIGILVVLLRPDLANAVVRIVL